MDFQEIITNKVNAMRAERLKNSPQITLGELIAKIEPIVKNWEKKKGKKGDEPTVSFDFEYAYPTGLSSWRGAYAELALTFSFVGYGVDGYVTAKDFKPKKPTISEFLKMLKEAVGKTYTGWKGGDFVMGKTTPIWVANDGNSGNTAVIDVVDEEYQVILITTRCEY